ncbi:GntR family transcriptional regulator [Novispirillum itersonii]|uniref:GntR family transcriptional regulator n=1 Tax=Novispirillum itersonii TaxID=189 RepID=UPI0003613274|nr:GntR family transcriptional regulator [Novispirillum itersonii]
MTDTPGAASPPPAGPLSPDDPLPLYLQLASRLRAMVAADRAGQAAALPSERVLSERFGVSRVTVRKALRELIADGLLHPRQGAGTFVTPSPHREQRLSALIGFSEDMQSRGLEAGTVWLNRSLALATPEEAMALGIAPGSKVSRLYRLRLADGAPMALELTTVPTRFLPDPAVVSGSLYTVLRQNGFAPFRALQRLTAVILTVKQARLLEVPDGSAALSIERRTMLEDGTPVELVRSHYRGEVYDVVVELNLTDPA